MIRAVRDETGGPEPAISVVIPVLDGGPRFGELLSALGRQRARGAVEIVIVDSGSTDGSRERALDAGARLFEVPRRAFAHGRTRNAAVAHARARWIVLMTQDAVPRGRDFLATLVAPFDGDPALAGTYARQVPPPGTDPLVAAALARWTPAGADRRQSALTPAEFDRLPAPERARRCRFDNVASAVRRGAWEAHPFPDVPFGEDAVWARDVLCAGYDLLFRAAAEVEHAHAGGARAAYRRDRDAHEMLSRHFGLRTVRGPAAAAGAWLAGWGSDLADLRAQGVPARDLTRGLLRGARRRAGALAGQWVGGLVGGRNNSYRLR